MTRYAVTIESITEYRREPQAATILPKRTIAVEADTEAGAKLLAIDAYASDPSIRPFLASIDYARAKLYAAATLNPGECITCGRPLDDPLLAGYPSHAGRCFLCHETWIGGAL